MKKSNQFLFSLLLMSLVFFGQNIDAQKQLNMPLLGQFTFSEAVNDIWGYTSPNNREFAILGRQTGVSIVEITDAANPVEVFSNVDVNSNWRDIKTWNQHAYITNETGGGLHIIDLTDIENGNVTSTFSDCGFGYIEAHNIFIDEGGKAFLFGAKSSTQINSNYILDLNADPKNPTYLGQYDTYIHDGFVRGDTLWASQIYAGNFAVVDVSNPAMPIVLATQASPKNFAHACWLSPDASTLSVADEKSGAWVTTYDVTDLSDIQEIDRYQTPYFTDVVMHNTFYKSNFIFNSYYTEGVVILDATKPENLVRVGQYDTSNFDGSGYNGCWGVFPYFDSGKIIASDRQDGLFIFDFNETKAAYLEGTVTDATTGNALSNAEITILDDTHFGANSNFTGFYDTGIAGSNATAEVVFSASGYLNDTLTVNLIEGQTAQANANLQPLLDCPNAPVFQAKAYLEAFWDAANSVMTNELVVQELLPQLQPFTYAPFNYSGTERVDVFPAETVDWVLLELRNENDSSLVETRAAFLKTDGNLMELDGTLGVHFCNATAGQNYFVSLLQRSHLGAMTTTAVSLPNASAFDFSSAMNNAAGIEQLKEVNGLWMLFVGDFDGNGIVNNNDFNLWAQQSSVVSQYVKWDADGNGVVNSLDYNWWVANRSKVGFSLIQR